MSGPGRLAPALLLLALLAALVVVGSSSSEPPPRQEPANGTVEIAILAGGCFWCLEADLEKLEGVFDAESGYTGGHVENPDYAQVGRGRTGHTEAVRVRFDPDLINYAELLEHFWRNIDPTVPDQQFCDRGPQYRSGIYWLNQDQRVAAMASLAPVQARFGTVYTQIEAAGTFWPAEDYHQDYARRNPLRYRYYRSRCGRDSRLQTLWSGG